MIIAVDFDGTIVEDQFPQLGPPLPGAIEWLKRFNDEGSKLILYTMRAGPHLAPALAYLELCGVSLWAVNENPEQHTWSDSRKVYAHVYIDDAALGCPTQPIEGGRPAVDWGVVGPWVLAMIERERENGSR
jgi:hydroxymethylpyrimidine pyrophosphatase-like HAD family hydrolase